MKIKKSLINYNLLMIIILLNIVFNYAFSNIVIGFNYKLHGFSKYLIAAYRACYEMRYI